MISIVAGDSQYRIRASGRRTEFIFKKIAVTVISIGFAFVIGAGNTETVQRAATVQMDEETYKNDIICAAKQSLFITAAGIPELSESPAETEPQKEEVEVIAPEILAQLSTEKLTAMTEQVTVTDVTSAPIGADSEDMAGDQYEVSEDMQTYSESEKEMIAYVVWAEARGECFEGKAAVAQVVINRFESGKFGDSIKRVVYAKHQFAVGSKYDENCMEAVEHAISNRPYPDTMVYFQKSKSKNWYGEYFDRIGNHTFFCVVE